jgi:hypothetical protein
MTNGTETPTTDELAKELAATEGTDSPETAPDPAPAEAPAPDAPAEPAAETPAPATPAAEPDKTIAPPVNGAQADKKAADTTRRKKAVADAPAVDTNDQDEEDARKAKIYDQLEAVQAEVDEHLDAVKSCKAQARDLMAELYPHSLQSDTLVDAVRGHIAAQKKIRASRASNPARIAEILKAAGRSPIDQAFHVQRARGARRPTRSPPKPAGGDSGAAAPTE